MRASRFGNPGSRGPEEDLSTRHACLLNPLGAKLSTPLNERPKEDLEAAVAGVEGRKQAIAVEALRRRYLAKGWSDWLARLKIFALRKGWLRPSSKT